MSTTPPPAAPPPPPEQPHRGYGYAHGAANPLAGMTIPFNSELVLYLIIEFIFSLLWWVTDEVTKTTWMGVTAALTIGYLISRGIAKASRVIEQ
jgi:hypothetical protein